jgi:hypothetical protein
MPPRPTRAQCVSVMHRARPPLLPRALCVSAPCLHLRVCTFPGHSPRSIPRFPSPFTPSSLSGARSRRARPHLPLLTSRAHGHLALAALRAASLPQMHVVGPYRLLPSESRLPICAAAPPPYPAVSSSMAAGVPPPLSLLVLNQA